MSGNVTPFTMIGSRSRSFRIVICRDCIIVTRSDALATDRLDLALADKPLHEPTPVRGTVMWQDGRTKSDARFSSDRFTMKRRVRRGAMRVMHLQAALS